MQITTVEVTPVELKLRRPVKMAGMKLIEKITAVFVRMETRDGRNAWGCSVAHLELTGVQPSDLLHACRAFAERVPSLHPFNIEYSLAELAGMPQSIPAALCAYDLAFHDLLGLAADMPLYRLLGGYRNRIQTSATVPVSSVQESVEISERLARLGFRLLKIKGGLDPDEDVERVQAVHRAFPNHTLRLDADGGYTIQQAVDVARALEGQIEMLEQPTPAGELDDLGEVTRRSPVPILADQSASGPASALSLASKHRAHGLSIKVGACGGLQCARQVDAIARAARMSSMVGCLVEPALLTAAGLSFALSSPNVLYGDLDGYLDLLDDPTIASGFRLEDGWLIASEVPGLGCTVALD